SFSKSPISIEHINTFRAITISANVDKTKTTTNDVITHLSKNIFPQLKQQYNVNVSFGGETKEDSDSQASMKLGFIISLILIYVLLAIPLKSYTKPIIVMTVIPFGIIGAIAGHLILGVNLSILSFFGIIALSGVVVNDSLLLISTIQQYRNEGMSLEESLHITALRRFRPVILTSITTFAGLAPMLFETSFQAQFLIPMSISLGFGIFFATAITLILVPVLYFIFNDIKNIFYKEVSPEHQNNDLVV
ncbi:MAG: efflux RND transporter permease subunit, partial [Ostreibacterium sp.]